MGIGNITWLCLLSFLIKTNSIPRGVCIRKFNDSTIENHCCLHYMYTSLGCKECAIGFTSTDGGPCFPCSYRTYGRRCRNTCSCNNNERCHHINGCMQNNETLSDLFNDTSTFHPNTIRSTATYDTSTFNPNTISSTGTYGILTRDIILYSFTTTTVIVLIIIICYLQKRRNREGDIRFADGNVNTRSNLTGRRMTLANGEGMYHTIDKNALDDHTTAIQHTSVEPLDRSGRDITSENDKTSLRMEIESDESSDANPENISDYLNPYQPVFVTDRHDNEYIVLTTERRNSSQSTSPSESDTDSYLNPYQAVRKPTEHIEESYNTPMRTVQGNEAITTGEKSDEHSHSSSSDGSY